MITITVVILMENHECGATPLIQKRGGSIVILLQKTTIRPLNLLNHQNHQCKSLAVTKTNLHQAHKKTIEDARE